jgi:predicted 3-demethylubiquinone-9 3-methyltransferase (glyoxalase superfamily)
MQKITPFLWFNDQAEEAMNFYTSIFKNSKVKSITRYGDAGPGPKGSVMIGNFELDGQEFIALNGGPQFTFSPAISFVVNCESQQEIDEYWEKLSAGGVKHSCGWVQDRYGVSWQVVPTALGKLMNSGNAAKANNVMKALLQMGKLEIKKMEEAFEQG